MVLSIFDLESRNMSISLKYFFRCGSVRHVLRLRNIYWLKILIKFKETILSSSLVDEWLGVLHIPAARVICRCQHAFTSSQVVLILEADAALEPETRVDRVWKSDRQNVLRYFYVAAFGRLSSLIGIAFWSAYRQSQTQILSRTAREADSYLDCRLADQLITEILIIPLRCYNILNFFCIKNCISQPNIVLFKKYSFSRNVKHVIFCVQTYFSGITFTNDKAFSVTKKLRCIVWNFIRKLCVGLRIGWLWVIITFQTELYRELLLGAVITF